MHHHPERRRVADWLDRLLVGAGCLLAIGAPLIAAASCTIR
ncbi:hypothetical protein N0X72_25250 [Streptomyces carpaticus]|nr:hypothetical protein N0X72_25250 [Streptomyces carpaticus]